MNYEILEALGQIAQEKNVNRDLVIETLEIGLLSAAKKRYGAGDNVEVAIDRASGEITVFLTRQVVEDDDVEDPGLQVPFLVAREIDPDTEVGSDLKEKLDFADFGRNAIQTAKQILIQRVREAERERIFEDYQGRVGEIVSGTVQQISHGDVLVNLGRTEAVVPLKEQIRKERYRQGDPIRACLVNVLRTSKGPQLVLSRTHPSLLVKLFQLEVPEIYEGVIEIKAVAREPGERAKIAVHSNDPRIDPVGACVGMKGSRVQAVVRELGNERIDIIPWSDDEAIFLSRALSPAIVKRVVVDRRDKQMMAIVDDDQLSLAIGKSGQNARLASQLSGWKVDIMNDTSYQVQQQERTATMVPLSDVAGIGKVMRERLEASGIVSANDVAASTVARLMDVPGIGDATAEKIRETATEVVAVVVEAYRKEKAERDAIEAEERRIAEEAAAKEAEEAAAKEAEEAAAKEAEEAAAAEAAGESATDGGAEGGDVEAEEVAAAEAAGESATDGGAEGGDVEAETSDEMEASPESEAAAGDTPVPEEVQKVAAGDVPASEPDASSNGESVEVASEAADAPVASESGETESIPEADPTQAEQIPVADESPRDPEAGDVTTGDVNTDVNKDE